LLQAVLELVLVADIAATAGVHVGVDLGLGVAVPIDAAGEDALGAWPAVGTAPNITSLDLGDAVGTGGAGGRQVGVTSHVSAYCGGLSAKEGVDSYGCGVCCSWRRIIVGE
jgi:hypothetical protein